MIYKYSTKVQFFFRIMQTYNEISDVFSIKSCTFAVDNFKSHLLEC